MTLQQLRYIVAIDRYRSFAKAAESCGISQPTLSAMLVKLEEVMVSGLDCATPMKQS